jgi:transposase-like protein
VLTHVLAMDSTQYGEVIATASSSILDGCVCASCGSDELELTGRFVFRGLQTGAESYRQIQIRLARCRVCKHRERILPCDVLPGKVNSTENIFNALAAVDEGLPVAEVARRHGVSRACVRKWVCGAGARYLDLCELVRHRAMISGPSTRAEARLVRFSGFLSAAQRETGMAVIMPSLDMVPESEERRKAVGSLLVCLSVLGGILGVCRLGAELFGQAVLLFRCLGSDTPSSIEKSGGFGQDGGCETWEGCDDQTAGSSGVDSVVALRANRGPVARGSPVRGSRGIDTTVEQDTCGVAIRRGEAGIPGESLSLAGTIRGVGVIGLGAASSVGPWSGASDVSRWID